ncbi:Ger(x)C family spore germination protein [Sporosalibacterium faouarense]|uniref:Ger(x)C family spore germination protein n=1 Tax=Sporosalibacterium faouarense TaxID=516123 RepID=UPI00141C9D2C|nr:Ger(x)C family spore germination protein [Sporosalibacterium faouarense]MTI47568.1 Ger(x)C family spore germination protein [Bacillota bacterium]
MRKICLLLIFILTIILMIGCWDFKQIDNYYILTGLSIDKGEDNELIVSTRISAPITGLQTSNTFTTEGRVISRKGTTILNALQKMSNELKKEIFLGHLQVIIISKEIAKTDVANIVDSLSRNPNIQRKLYIIVCQEEAKKVMEAVNPLDVAPIPDLVNMFDINKTNNFIPITLDEFIFKYKSSGYDALLPIAKVSNQIIEVNGMAIFHNNSYIGELNGEESRVLSLLIYPKFTTEYYTLSQKDTKNTSDFVTVKIDNKSSKIKVNLKDNRIETKLYIKLYAQITEYSNTKENQDVQQLYNIVSKQLEERLKIELESLIKKSKEYNTDILGIGKYVRAKYQDYWDTINWEDKYSNTKFSTDINVIIRSSSSTKLIAN